MKKIITLVFVILCFSTCSVQLGTNSKYRNVPKTYLSLKIFQTLDDTSALCHDANHDIVKVIIKDKLLYDGLTMYGTFVLIDTYRYVIVKDVVKTVPVYMPFDDYIELQESLAADSKLSESDSSLMML